MAHTSFKIQYQGTVEVVANKEYTASSFALAFPGANMFMLKSKSKTNVPISVSINKTPMFQLDYMETTAYDGTSSFTYVFNQNCLILICKDLEI